MTRDELIAQCANLPASETFHLGALYGQYITVSAGNGRDSTEQAAVEFAAKWLPKTGNPQVP